MNEDDVLQEAGEWYIGVLDAVAASFKELIPSLDDDTAYRFAPVIVASLARQGYIIERDESREVGDD